MYTCGIIMESLNDISMLSKISAFLFKTRLQKLPDKEPDIWHVNEYHILESDLISLLPKLIENIKEGWYIKKIEFNTSFLNTLWFAAFKATTSLHRDDFPADFEYYRNKPFFVKTELNTYQTITISLLTNLFRFLLRKVLSNAL